MTTNTAPAAGSIRPEDIVPPMSGVVPHLVVRGAAAALEFYAKAFGAVEMLRLPAPDGRLIHAQMRVNGATVLLEDEFSEMGSQAPTSLRGTPVRMHLPVPDIDALYARAVGAGAKSVMPPADMFWGDRYGVVEDPFGHRWSMATPKHPMTVAQMQAATRAMFAQSRGAN